MKLFSAIVLMFFVIAAEAQQPSRLVIAVKDSASQKALEGVSIIDEATKKGGTTNSTGVYILNTSESGNKTLQFSSTGYGEKTVNITLPFSSDTLFVLLSRKEAEMAEVVVTSTRSSANRIEDLPMKVEVLGQEETKEESGIKPGNVASLLGDLSVIHIQNTSAVSGSNAIRMQGLDGKYTQLLRDGVPVYEGISGNFGVLAIPPLDLKQIEIIKGSISTLYGGGAIAGMINFVSKTPTKKPELDVLLNHSTLKESNVNVYYAQRWTKTGVTFFAGTTQQKAVDVNKDGFSDVPQLHQYIIHPKFFYYINPRTTLTAGYTGTFENRNGGDMHAIGTKEEGISKYFDNNTNSRHSVDVQYTQRGADGGKFTAKAVGSIFNVNENEKYFLTHGQQLNSYAELSYNKVVGKNDLVIGLNNTSENYSRKPDDSTLVHNYFYNTTGLFAQDGIHFSDKFITELGLRVDYHNRYQWFVLPRIAFVYKPIDGMSIRLSSGTGYKVPEVFTSQTQMMGYQKLLPLADDVQSEKSYGINFDANYEFKLGEVKLTVNQAVYYTNIQHAIIPVVHADGYYSLQSAPFNAHSLGTDTYIQSEWNNWELYVGYNHTVSKYRDDANTNFPFAPRDKFASTFAYSIEGKWRMGIENSWVGSQYLPDNTKAPNYWFWAAMVQHNFGEHFSVVLNCENIFDVRQGKNEPLYTGPMSDPQFKPLWGPIDGRAVNLSVKFSL